MSHVFTGVVGRAAELLGDSETSAGCNSIHSLLETWAKIHAGIVNFRATDSGWRQIEGLLRKGGRE